VCSHVASVLVTSAPSSAPTDGVPRHPQPTWPCMVGQLLWAWTRQIPQGGPARQCGLFRRMGWLWAQVWEGDMRRPVRPGKYAARGSRGRLCRVCEWRKRPVDCGNVFHAPALPLSHIQGSLLCHHAAVLSSQGSRQRAGLATDMQPVGRGGGSAVFLSGDSGQWTAETCAPPPHCPTATSACLWCAAVLLSFHRRAHDSAQGWRSTCSPWVAGRFCRVFE
jgi:hypothetical protein